MTEQSAQELQRQFAAINRMFRGFDMGRESDNVERIRRDLMAQGLIVKQCPEWCASMNVLCACVLDAKPANECIVSGVVPGDFVIDKTKLKKFADIL